MAPNRFFHYTAAWRRALLGKHRCPLQPGWRRSLIPLLFLAGLLLWTPPFSHSAGAPLSLIGEYELKAVYLFNFLHFVRWPEREDHPVDGDLKVIGIIGKSPLYDALLQLRDKLRGSDRGDMTLIDLGPYRPDMDLHRCDLVFVSGSEKENFARITNALKNTPALTVSDSDGFLAAGGMIALVTRDNKVRWEINRTPAQAVGLRFSAKLLDIAVRVVALP